MDTDRINDFVYSARNLVEALYDRAELFDKDDELKDLMDELQGCIDEFTGLDDDDDE